MDQNQKIKKFAEQIEKGYALKLMYEKAGMEMPVIPKFTIIENITIEQSMFSYISKVINTFSPDLLIATTKDRNGNSLHKPRVYHMTVEKQPSFGGLGSTSADPMSEYYKAQNSDLNRQLSRLEANYDSLTTKYEGLKEVHDTTKRQLDTIEERNELVREKDRVASENTFAGIVKELKPEIQGLIGIATSKYGDKSDPEPQLGGLNSDSKLAVLLSLLNSLGDADFSNFWELIVRFGQVDGSQRNDILELLRSETKDFDAQLLGYNSKPNK